LPFRKSFILTKKWETHNPWLERDAAKNAPHPSASPLTFFLKGDITMINTKKIQKIKELLVSNIGTSQQVIYRKESNSSVFYITMKENITAVLFPLKFIEELDISNINDNFKNKIKLYDAIKSSASIRVTIDNDIVIWPNHEPPLNSI
jgi:hypothetical protein